MTNRYRIEHSAKMRARRPQLAFAFLDQPAIAVAPAKSPEPWATYRCVVFLRAHGDRVYRAGHNRHLVNGKIRDSRQLKQRARASGVDRSP